MFEQLLPFVKILVIRELLHTRKRQEETVHHLKTILADVLMSCEIELAGVEFTACLQGSPYLPSSIAEELFSLELPHEPPNRSLPSNSVVVEMDNTISRSHTIVQLLCLDHKGLVYDIMRTLKDYNVQVNYKTRKFHYFKYSFPFVSEQSITNFTYSFDCLMVRFLMDGSIPIQKGNVMLNYSHCNQMAVR